MIYIEYRNDEAFKILTNGLQPPHLGACDCINFIQRLDPACGSGSLLIRAVNEAQHGATGYGQEKDVATAGLAKMNAVLHNQATITIKAGNTFSDPQFKHERNGRDCLDRFDFVVANPPFSMKNWTHGLAGHEYGRFDGYGATPPEKNGDFAWLLHILKIMKEDAKAAVILPHGVLFRGNAESIIRENMVQYIKGIISLPANLFYGTPIPVCIIVLDKENVESLCAYSGEPLYGGTGTIARLCRSQTLFGG